MQAYFLPYIGYFHLIDAVDKFRIYEHVSFRKSSWIQRNRILDKGTRNPLWINVPLKDQSSHQKIKNIRIDHSKGWQKVILKKIFLNYKKAKFFEEVHHSLEDIIKTQADDIHEYNSLTTMRLCKLLSIGTEIQFINDDCQSIEEQLVEGSGSLDLEVKSQRIIQICKYEKAETYINPSGGTEIYDKTEFKTHNINLVFMNSGQVNYDQFGMEFTPNLSIVDVLMHNGIEGTKEIIKNYNTI